MEPGHSGTKTCLSSRVGIARAGMNDCGALDGSHGCAGQAKAYNVDSEWVYVPKGSCANTTL
jgi:uncharacterized membrane protein